MINYSFKRMKDSELFTFSDGVVQRTTADPQFVSLKSQAEALKKYYDAYSIALSAAKLGGIDRLALRDTCRKDLVTELDIIAQSVEVLSRGNEQMQLDAGFEIRKATSPKTIVVTPPSNLSVLNTERSGEVRLSWKPSEGALTHAVEQRQKDETIWHNGEYTSKSEILLSGYDLGKCIEFRVRTLGRGEKKSDWTSAVGVWVA